MLSVQLFSENKFHDCILHLKHPCNDTDYKKNISALQTAFSTVWDKRSKRRMKVTSNGKIYNPYSPNKTVL
jgi:hypothetical protein